MKLPFGLFPLNKVTDWEVLLSSCCFLTITKQEGKKREHSKRDKIKGPSLTGADTRRQTPLCSAFCLYYLSLSLETTNINT